MKERPILFSGPMVRAILEERKTQTRRVVKTPGWNETMRLLDVSETGEVWGYDPMKGGDRLVACPYGQPGDTLWCRETFAEVATPSRDEDPEEFKRERRGIQYRADWDDPNEFPLPWTPSIHMPRWASRITLEVVSVRVERLQDISTDDCVAEGVREGPLQDNEPAGEFIGQYHECSAPYLRYRSLWESINGPGSWDANPWVWVVSFSALKPQPRQA